MLEPFKDVVFRLQNYYEGYDDSKEEKMKRKLQFEKERFMNVSHPEYTHTYDRYLQYIEDQDIIEYENQLKADRKQCVCCHKYYYGNPFEKLNTNNAKDLPNLCEVCSKKYISGFSESGSANKKIARILEDPQSAAPKYKVNDNAQSGKGSNEEEKNSNKSKNNSTANK